MSSSPPPDPPSQMPEYQVPPVKAASPQDRIHGWGLATAVIIYVFALWFTIVGFAGTSADATSSASPICDFAITVLIIETVVLLIMDWGGLTSLNGLVQRERLTRSKKFWLVCGFLFIPEIMLGIYLVRRIQHHYQETQQPLGQQMRHLVHRFKSASRPMQFGIAGSTLVGVIMFCSLTSLAMTPSHPAMPDPQVPAAAAANTAQSGHVPTTVINIPAGPTPTHAPTATTTPAYAHFGDGTFQVGKDIQPGTYRTRDGSSGCYYARLKGFGGTVDDIIANNNTDAPAIVTIAATDQGFESQNCGTWTQNLSPITKSLTTFDDGMYLIGTDIIPGTYKNTGSQGCYYARLSGFGGSVGDIIANNNTDAVAIVTIRASDKGFESTRCGTWTKQ